MCSIFGVITHNGGAEDALAVVMQNSIQRGRDGWGIFSHDNSENVRVYKSNTCFNSTTLLPVSESRVIIGNTRAEPTTEYVKDKTLDDQQPYLAGDWAIVHNGTIANDKQLRTHAVRTPIDSACIAEILDTLSCTVHDIADCVKIAAGMLVGSYAILIYNIREHRFFAVCNYRPIWYAVGDTDILFASCRSYFPSEYVPQMVPPYSIVEFDVYGVASVQSLYGVQGKNALVVCSGGMDSVVAACYAKKTMGFNITLLNFQYGCIAEFPERTAIQNVAKFLDAPLVFLQIPIYGKKDSPLFDTECAIASTEDGAEFAHEWVPARNLVMLSIATAYAEANGFDTIILGNNLEEAGAYPDNEPEFIARFNDILPFAVGANKRLAVSMPVGNMMKHEIVALGKELGAPLHLTWSCYKNGPVHCGKCGPCFMRKKAFEMNGLVDPMEYEV